MPVVKTEKRYFAGEAVELKVKCNSDGEFSADLPAFCVSTLGYNIVKDKSLEVVIKKWTNAAVEYTDTKTKSEKVILYEVQASAYIWDFKGDKLIADFQDGGSHKEGLSLTVFAVVANEFQLTKPDGKIRYRYEEVETDLPESMADFRHFDWRLHGEQATGRLPWTKERQEFFAKIGRSMEQVILQLKQLSDPKRALEIADKGRLLEFK